MYLSYQLFKNDKLKYARAATRSQNRATYFLTYGLINFCVIMLVLSFFFYYLSTPIVIEHMTIPPRDELGIFFITLFMTILLALVAWHYKKQFAYLFQLALEKTSYKKVEIWADPAVLRCRLDDEEFILNWERIKIHSTTSHTCLMADKEHQHDVPFILIPTHNHSTRSLVECIRQWKYSPQVA